MSAAWEDVEQCMSCGTVRRKQLFTCCADCGGPYSGKGLNPGVGRISGAKWEIIKERFNVDLIKSHNSYIVPVPEMAVQK